MLRRMLSIAVVLGLAVSSTTKAADTPPKRLLLVTHSGGFMHDSIFVAEQILKEIGPKHGFTVTTWRFTNDPSAKVKFKTKVDGVEVEKETTALEKYSEQFRKTTGGDPVTKELCGRINAESLKNFDAVL